MGRVLWKVGDALPANLHNPILQTLLPRPLAWITVDEEHVALLEGFTAASYTPPSFLFPSQAIPSNMLQLLIQTKKCSISCCTARDPFDLVQSLLYDGRRQEATYTRTQAQVDLTFRHADKQDYPPVVITSPLHFYCQLDHFVPLDEGNQQGMIVLTAETVVIHNEAQSQPTADMLKSRPNLVSKVDATCIQPLVSMGEHRIAQLDYPLQSLPRPIWDQQRNTWTSRELAGAQPPIPSNSVFPKCEWNYREHGGTSPLGFNATTAVVMPRPIGWISTYSQDERCPHLAPYSFFMDVNRDLNTPMVAFSAFRKNDEPKDAQKDAQETGNFCFNLVSRDLIVPMNLSAAEIPRHESEFALAQLEYRPGDWVDAPCVSRSLVTYECEYVQTVDMASFSIVIGKVIGVSIDECIIEKKSGQILVDKVQPMTRLGYMDEYGVVGPSKTATSI